MIFSATAVLLLKMYIASGLSRDLTNAIDCSIDCTAMIGSTGPKISSCISASVPSTLVTIVGDR